MHESYRNSLPLHGVGVDEDRSSLHNNGPSRSPYDILTIEGITIDFKLKTLNWISQKVQFLLLGITRQLVLAGGVSCL
jgi:hypothetical protein